jgi:hypothetical protein
MLCVLSRYAACLCAAGAACTACETSWFDDMKVRLLSFVGGHVLLHMCFAWTADHHEPAAGNAISSSMLISARCTALCCNVQVCDEVDRFAGDIAHLDGLDFEQELNSDFVLAARLNLSK